jgi:hypothetical protein
VGEKENEFAANQRRLVNTKISIIGIAALCAAVTVPCQWAHAQAADSALLNALVKKGVLSDSEAQEIQAQDQKEYNETSASKINLSSSIKSITFYGDMRMRYEMRDGTTPSGYTGNGGVKLTAGDSEDRNAFRYRLRIGVKGSLYDNFFFGIRAATNPYYDRSGNVTFGHSDAAGPFGKAQSLMGIDQVYLGWHATDDITLTGGQMPNPLYTTNLIWSDDLSPAGAAEQWDHKFDNDVEVFATAGQFIYSAAAGNGFTNGLGNNTSNSTTFMYAEQAGFKYNFDKDTFFKAAATIYTYSGTSSSASAGTVASLYSSGATTPIQLSAPNASPSYFNGPFVGAASAPVSNVSGINDLAVLETPMEFDFKIGPGVHKSTSVDPKDAKAMETATTGWVLPMRIFADFAYNFEANERADAARNAIDTLSRTGASNLGVTSQGSAAANANMISSPGFQGVLNSGKNFLDQSAYQIGVEAGQLKKKGDWDAKLWWQSTGYYAVDPNLIDADIFNAATNMQGVVVAVSHNWTDGLTSTVRYAYAMPVNGRLATPNVNQDLQEGDIRQYNLFQADLMWKF